jgi:hypothetical protein
MYKMSSSSGASHTDSGEFAAWEGTDKEVYCGHLLLYGECKTKGGQVKIPREPVGKIYNKCSGN